MTAALPKTTGDVHIAKQSGEPKAPVLEGETSTGCSRLRKSVKNHQWHLATTVSLCLGMVVKGIYYELTGPTLPLLKQKVGADYEQISRVLVLQNAAILLSCFAGGYLADRYRRQVALLLSVTQLGVALLTGGATWARHLWLLSLLYFVQGLGIGPLTVAGNAWIIWMWGANAAVPNYAFHWSFGIGAFIAPQLAKPFISDVDITGEQQDSDYSTTVLLVNTPTPVVNTPTPGSNLNASQPQQPSPDEFNIEYAYLICGFLAAILSAIYLVLQCNRSKIHYNSEDADSDNRQAAVPRRGIPGVLHLLSPARCTGTNNTYGTAMVALVFLYHFLVVGGERSWGKFLFSYAKESASRGDLHMDSGEMSDLQSTFWLLFFIGRGVSTLAAQFVSPVVVMSVVHGLYLITAVLLALLAHHPTALWLLSSALGALVAPLFPGMILIYRDYIHISAMIMAMSEAGAAFGGMFFQWVSGYLLEYQEPQALLYFNILHIVALILVYVSVLVTGTCYVRRRRANQGGASTTHDLPIDSVTALTLAAGSNVTIVDSKL